MLFIVKDGRVSAVFHKEALFPEPGSQSFERTFQGIMPSREALTVKAKGRTALLFICVSSITFHKALGDVCLIELTADLMSRERSFGFLSGILGSSVVFMFSFHALI